MTKDEVLLLIGAHIPSLTDENEERIEYLIGESMSGDPDADVANYALRTCRCGEIIDGFYEYVDHLKGVIRNA